MIKACERMLPNNFFKVFHVYHVTSFWINFPRNLYNQFVVVTMIVGVIAFAEDCLIFYFFKRRIIQPVGSIKIFFSKNLNSHV